MNQIEKRLEIIKLAIFMTDPETIKLQLLKLEPFEDNKALNEIISFLRQKNYAQAQALIDLYNKTERKQQNIKSQIEPTLSKEDSLVQEIQEPTIQSNTINEISDVNKVDNHISQKQTNNTDAQQIEIDNSDNIIEKQTHETEEISTEHNTDNKIEFQGTSQYPPIADIVDKIQKMTTTYLDKEMYVFHKSVDSWIHYISEIGYTDKGILNMFSYVQNLKNKKQNSEATQLVIVFGATNSNLGRLLFARELYLGELFQKDDNKAFELIKELASDNCSEALCDLGQFYEYGVGTEMDTKQAQYYYKQALELDSHRAKHLYSNIRKKNKGFFSFLFKDEDDIL